MDERLFKELVEVLRRVASAHSHIETANMPEWLEDVENVVGKADHALYQEN